MLTKNSLPRRDQQAICHDRPRQGADRAARALRPRLPQRHAAGDRRLSGGLHRHPLHRRAADRGDLLARRPRPARLRGGDQPRLSGHVRHALHLHADRAVAEPHQRPHLHARRSAHRFRDARPEHDARSRRSARDCAATSAPTGAASGRCGSSCCCSSSACSPTSSPTTGRCSCAIDGHFYFPVFADYPETDFGGDLPTAADYRDPALAKRIAAKAGWSGRRFPSATTPSTTICRRPAPSPPDRGQLARHRRSGPRRAGAADLRLSHLGAVRPDPDDLQLGRSASPPARCRAISAAGSISRCSASSRSGPGCRCSSC